MEIIVADLTRFNNANVCIAGINPETGVCVRPRPYLSKANSRKWNILPGAILKGQFTPQQSSPPHVEDHSHENLSCSGTCSSTSFRNILAESVVESVENGFSVPIPEGQKHISPETPPSISIVTIAIQPEALQIVMDCYNKLRVHLEENSGRKYEYISITDLGFYEYAVDHATDDAALGKLNKFLHKQEEVFVRVGLSQVHQSPDGRRGFWIQANGIYTFPDCPEDIRCYHKD